MLLRRDKEAFSYGKKKQGRISEMPELHFFLEHSKIWNAFTSPYYYFDLG
jgi:hypothetical protein